jgi:hypothetical protein
VNRYYFVSCTCQGPEQQQIFLVARQEHPFAFAALDDGSGGHEVAKINIGREQVLENTCPTITSDVEKSLMEKVCWIMFNLARFVTIGKNPWRIQRTVAMRRTNQLATWQIVIIVSSDGTISPKDIDPGQTDS